MRTIRGSKILHFSHESYFESIDHISEIRNILLVLVSDCPLWRILQCALDFMIKFIYVLLLDEIIPGKVCKGETTSRLSMYLQSLTYEI